MTRRYTVAQIEAAIPQAIQEHDFTAVISLMNMLAVRDPQRARALLNGIHAALNIMQAANR